MVLFNHATKEVTAKLVYYGPGLCGKTTNLQWVHENVSFKSKGKMLSLATEADRTLFFDFLPVELGTIRGHRTRVQIYTVPGQVFYDSTRRMVLKGADAIVFVADSQEAMLDANLESLESLRRNLIANDLDPALPMVLQYNKRDLPTALPVSVLNARINVRNLPAFEAIAFKGVGVEDTLKGVTKLLFKTLADFYGTETTPKAPVPRSSEEASPAPAARPAPPNPAAPPPVATRPAAAPPSSAPQPAPLPSPPTPAPSPPAARAPVPTPAPAPTVTLPVPAPAPAPTVRLPVPTPAPAPTVTLPVPTPAPAPTVTLPVPTPAPAPTVTLPVPTPAPAPTVRLPAPTPAPAPTVRLPVPTPAPAPTVRLPVPTPAPAPTVRLPVPTPAPVPTASAPVRSAGPAPKLAVSLAAPPAQPPKPAPQAQATPRPAAPAPSPRPEPPPPAAMAKPAERREPPKPTPAPARPTAQVPVLAKAPEDVPSPAPEPAFPEELEATPSQPPAAQPSAASAATAAFAAAAAAAATVASTLATPSAAEETPPNRSAPAAEAPDPRRRRSEDAPPPNPKGVREDQWLYLLDKQQKGPLDIDDLIDLVLTSLSEETMVWRPGLRDWTAAKMVPEIAEQIPPPLPFTGAGEEDFPDFNNVPAALRSALIADEDEGFRKLLALPLAAQGFRIFEAPDGNEAWRLAAEHRPWMMLADIDLPEIDGFEFCRRVRANSLLSHTPFVFISGSDKFKDRARAQQVGSDDFLSKQTPIRELLIRIQLLLARYSDLSARTTSETSPGQLLLLEGQIEVFGAPGVLQICNQSRLTGIFTARVRQPDASVESVAVMGFRDGEIINATVQDLTGTDAVYAFLGWQRGHFKFVPGAPGDGAPLAQSVEHLLLEGCRLLDESGRGTEGEMAPT